MSRCDRHDEDRPPTSECCEGCVNEAIRETSELAEWSATKAIAEWLVALSGQAFAAGEDAKARLLRDDIAKKVHARADAMRAAYDKRKEER